MLSAMIGFATPLQAQAPPVMLAAPVRPMQPPFTPVPPASPVVRDAAEISMPNDIVIQRYIHSIFTTDKLLRHFGIHVTVQDGVAIMTGTADSWQDYFRAEKDAFAAGAHAVDNRLGVRFYY